MKAKNKERGTRIEEKGKGKTLIVIGYTLLGKKHRIEERGY
jgi:hypothetical protein